MRSVYTPVTLGTHQLCVIQERNKRYAHAMYPLYPSPSHVWGCLNICSGYGSYSEAGNCSQRVHPHEESAAGRYRLERVAIMSMITHSLGAQMSAIDPPTMVAPVDPNAPLRKRPTITVVMLGALRYKHPCLPSSKNENSQSYHEVCNSKASSGDHIKRHSPKLLAQTGCH
jgi:hypothetical protein